MKKSKLIILLISLFFVTGCNETDINPENNPTSSMDVDIIIDNGDGTTSDYSFIHMQLFYSFDDMVNYEYGMFIKGSLIRIEEFSEISNSYYFYDQLSGETYQVVIYKNYIEFNENNEYYLHIGDPGDEFEFYSLTELKYSVFPITDDGVRISDKFIEDFDSTYITEDSFEVLITKKTD